jgi:hypothetical protein
MRTILALLVVSGVAMLVYSVNHEAVGFHTEALAGTPGAANVVAALSFDDNVQGLNKSDRRYRFVD